jgi:hypothetical protein
VIKQAPLCPLCRARLPGVEELPSAAELKKDQASQEEAPEPEPEEPEPERAAFKSAKVKQENMQ